MTLAWPASLRPSSAGWWLESPSRGGGVATDGSEQTVASLASRWRFRGTFHIRTTQQALDAFAFFTAIEGRATAFLMPAFTGLFQSWPEQKIGGVGIGVILHPGVTRHKELDGTIYADAEIPAASQITAIADDGVGIRGVQIGINVSQGRMPKAGQMFGVGERLHRIFEIVSTVGTVTTVKFRPPFRAGVSDDTPILFTRPVCRMKMLSDDQGPQDLELLRFADLTIEAREDY